MHELGGWGGGGGGGCTSQVRPFRLCASQAIMCWEVGRQAGEAGQAVMCMSWEGRCAGQARPADHHVLGGWCTGQVIMCWGRGARQARPVRLSCA